MTRQQKIALSRPALLAEECLNAKRYGQATALGTVVLTVNSGFE